MNKKRFSEAMSNVDDKYYDEAVNYKVKQKKAGWVRWGAMAACLFILVGVGTLASLYFNQEGGRGFGDGDATLSAEHRDDFTSNISSDVKAQLGDDVMKAYRVRENDWFLAESIEDYSQALRNEVIYMIPDDVSGNSNAYTVYAEKDGILNKSYQGTPPSDAALPYGFAGLSYSLIEEKLSDIDYNDYIVTYSYQLGAVIVWVQCSDNDLFVTYPTRPDLIGIEVGMIYTLPDMQEALKTAYEQQ